MGEEIQISARFVWVMLIVEQKVEQVLGIADRVLALNMGRVAFNGRPADAREQAYRLFLG